MCDVVSGPRRYSAVPADDMWPAAAAAAATCHCRVVRRSNVRRHQSAASAAVHRHSCRTRGQ